MNQINTFPCLAKNEIKLEKLNEFVFSDTIYDENQQQQQQQQKQSAQFDIYSEEYLLSVNEYNQKVLEEEPSNKTSYECFICDKQFLSEIDFVKHFTNEEKELFLNDNSLTSNLKCTACSEQFKFRKEFLQHKCEFIEYEDPLIQPNKLNSQLVDYLCKFCSLNSIQTDSNFFKTYADYSLHLEKTHIPTNKQTIQCSICDKIYLNLTEYYDHVTSEHCLVESSNWLRCGLCKFSTHKIDSLRQHVIRIHLNKSKRNIQTRTKLYCIHCKCIFQYRHDFESHLFQHIRSSPSEQYYCPICDQSGNCYFSDLNVFDEHVNENHAKYKCSMCSFTNNLKLTNGKEIEEHLMQTHLYELLDEANFNEASEIPSPVCSSLVEVENVLCYMCDKYFGSSTCLAIHLNKFHHSHVFNAEQIESNACFLPNINIKSEKIY